MWKFATKIQRTSRLGKQCRHNTSLNFSPTYIANSKQSLSYCKYVNIWSPNLLHLKVARYAKLYYGRFALRFGSALHHCLFILHNAHEHHALPCFLPTPCSALLCRFCSVPLPCTFLPCPGFSCFILSCPACKLYNFWQKRP